MSVWEVHADTEAHFLAVIAQLETNKRIGGITKNGVVIDGFLNDGTLFCLNYYKTKYVQTGTEIRPPFNYVVPIMTPLPGVYAIFLWLPPDGITPPPQPNPATGVTLIPLPADSPFRFAGY